VTTEANLERPQGLSRIDPALRAAAAELDVFEFRADSLAEERARADRASADRAARADTAGVAIEQRFITTASGHRLTVRIYRGTAESTAPLVLYAHGGGFVTGNLDTDHSHCVELARSAGCVVVSVEYRLAPEHRCPSALDDIEAALNHVIEHADVFGVDRRRVAVMGRDAGAALVAGLAQRVFDAEGPRIALQVLHQPMVDSDATPSRREFRRTPGLNGRAVEQGWAHYLGDTIASASSVPAYRINLEGLPPAFISCAEIDPCRDEAIEYANRLLHSYVHTELHVVAATFHGFDSAAPDWMVSREVRALHAQVLRRAFAV
jgi:acetyl esterase/lipase